MQNLTEEYRKACEQEEPDLWDRIEAGLADKKTAVRFRPARVRFARYAGLAASALILFAAVPLLVSIQKNGKSDNAATSLYEAAADEADAVRPRGAAAGEAAEENVVEEEAAVTYDAGGEEKNAAEVRDTAAGDAEDGLVSGSEEAIADLSAGSAQEAADSRTITEFFLTQVPEAAGAEITVDTEALFTDEDGRRYFLVTVGPGGDESGISGRFCVSEDCQSVLWLDEEHEKPVELDLWRG